MTQSLVQLVAFREPRRIGVLMLGGLMVGALFSSEIGFAAGKKRTSGGTGAVPAIQTPDPYRAVALKSVGTRPFQLPNGSRVDLAADLEVMLSTAVTGNSRFLPAEFQITPAPCEPRLELRAAVSTLELNIAELGISIGYKPTGENIPIASLTGNAKVKIGTIAMDFGVWQCVGSQCVELAAATASHLTAGVGLSLEIDFGVVNSGPALLYNTPLGSAIRSIMNQGISSLARNPRLSKLSWHAVVREFSQESGELIFDAGTAQGISPQQAFEVYAPGNAESLCDVYRAVATIRSVRVDTLATAASVETFYGARGIKAGDLVFIREVGGSR